MSSFIANSQQSDELAEKKRAYEIGVQTNPYESYRKSFLDKLIPGLGLWRLSKRIQGVSALFVFLVFTFLIVKEWYLFSEGLKSLGLSIFLSVISWQEFKEIFTSDITEFWISSVYLTIGICSSYYFSARSYDQLLRNGKMVKSSMSLSQVAWREFKKRTVAVAALYITVILYSIALLAPMIAPFDPNAQQDFVVTAFQVPLGKLTMLKLKEGETQNVPMREDETITSKVANSLIQTNYNLRFRGETERKLFVNEYRIEGDEIIYKQGTREKKIAVSKLFADVSASISERTYLMGTDQYGRDIFSRVIYGSRISLTIGLLVVLIAITVGTLLGVMAGYFGGLVDGVIMRTVDVLNAFPNIFLILIIIATFGNSIFLIVITIAFTGWMSVSRLVRGQVLSLKEQEFVQAAQALGLSNYRIIFKHLIPNSLTPVIVAATLRIGGIILTEAALSFLGLGVQPPTASWGNIISEGRDDLLNHWWISTFPGLAIVLTVVCFNLIGDGVRDALDPRMRE